MHKSDIYFYLIKSDSLNDLSTNVRCGNLMGKVCILWHSDILVSSTTFRGYEREEYGDIENNRGTYFQCYGR